MYPLFTISTLALTLHVLHTLAISKSASVHTHHAWMSEFNVNDCSNTAINATNPLWPKGLEIDARPMINDGACIPWYPAEYNASVAGASTVGIAWGTSSKVIGQVNIYSGTGECDASSKYNVSDSCCDDKQLMVVTTYDASLDENAASEGDGFKGTCFDTAINGLEGMRYLKGFTQE